MAGPAKNPGIEVFQTKSGQLSATIDPDEVRLLAAQLLGSGINAKRVATSMAHLICPNSTGDYVTETAYKKLRRWMRRDQSFRDLIYSQAVVKLDLESPSILAGLAKSAKRGRVDAIRMALEVTGRHTKDDAPVTQVAIILQNVARPE